LQLTLRRIENVFTPAGNKNTIRLTTSQQPGNYTDYEGWNFNNGNYLFTTDTK